jgi:hypothetical protein
MMQKEEQKGKLIPFTRFLRAAEGPCQILMTAVSKNTGEQLVVYQELFGEYQVYAERVGDFLSKSEEAARGTFGENQHDPEKEAEGSSEHIKAAGEASEDGSEHIEAVIEASEDGSEHVLDPMLERFLDARTTRQRLEILDEMRGHITNEMIDPMAIALGVEIDEEKSVQVRYEELRDCLATIHRYETERGGIR